MELSAKIVGSQLLPFKRDVKSAQIVPIPPAVRITIYSLSDPISDHVRYIGKTKFLEKRFRLHLQEAKSEKITHKLNWIRSLTKKGLEPILNVIDVIEENEWQFWERHYISLYKSWGFKLVNLTSGGEGSSGLIKSEETRRKISLAQKGRKLSPEHYSKVLEANRKRIEKDGAWNKGIKTGPNPEQSKRMKGKKNTEEQKIKISLKLKGRKKPPITEEHRRNMSISAKLRKKKNI